MNTRPAVLFKAAAGSQIGFGHLRRCLSLAQALEAAGAKCDFLSDGDKSARTVIESHHFEIHVAGSGADDPARAVDLAERIEAAAIVVDSYAVGTDYFQTLRTTGRCIVAIDDLANRELPVDVINNSGLAAVPERYRGALARTEYLLGPEFALLRPEFAAAPERAFDEHVHNVLVSVGGADPNHLTERLVGWLGRQRHLQRVDVVIGPLFDAEHQTAAGRFAQVMFHRDPPDGRQLMLDCDVAITGGGQTLYEVAATSTPALAVRIADNQTENLQEYDRRGVVAWVGDVADGALERRLEDGIERLRSPQVRHRMGVAGRALVDGRGAARVADCVMRKQRVRL